MLYLVMPAINSRKIYLENSFYHIYNRGVEKRKIFEDDQDYGVYLNYLKEYLSFRDIDLLRQELINSGKNWKEKKQLIRSLNINNFYEDLEMVAYSLMPNHFHFLVYQKDGETIDKFLNSLNTRYVMYFNKKNNRVGHLFQGVYKAVRITSQKQLVYVTAYIHRNIPKKSRLLNLDTLLKYSSSLADYLGLKYTNWLHAERILDSFFSKNGKNSYQDFILSSDINNKINAVSSLLIDY